MLRGILVAMPSASRDRVFRVLHLEDSELDHELLLAHLARGGIMAHTRRVESEADFLEALDEPWDIVVSDYNMPGFSGLVALELLKANARDVPFILVSGEIGEDTAVEAMRHGAADYLQKNHLARLVPALLHAVDAAETRRARVKADRDLVASKQRLHELAQHLQTSVELERAAIAREIHDDVGGSLTALKFDLAWIARHSSAPQVIARVQSALETVSHAVESSQRIMHNLRPAILEQGLAAALHWIALRFERRAGVGLHHPPAEEAARAAARRAAGRLPHRPGGADQHQQARATRRGCRSTCRWPAACSRSRSATTAAASARKTWRRRAPSASAACTSAPTPSAAGSICRAGRTARP